MKSVEIDKSLLFVLLSVQLDFPWGASFTVWRHPLRQGPEHQAESMSTIVFSSLSIGLEDNIHVCARESSPPIPFVRFMLFNTLDVALQFCLRIILILRELYWIYWLLQQIHGAVLSAF